MFKLCCNHNEHTVSYLNSNNRCPKKKWTQENCYNSMENEDIHLKIKQSKAKYSLIVV